MIWDVPQVTWEKVKYVLWFIFNGIESTTLLFKLQMKKYICINTHYSN